MKILAIEKELKGIQEGDYTPHLEREAIKAWELQQEGTIREIYFTDDHCAVLILEANGKDEARKILSELPLVKEKLIDFDLYSLNAYSGYARLFKKD